MAPKSTSATFVPKESHQLLPAYNIAYAAPLNVKLEFAGMVIGFTSSSTSVNKFVMPESKSKPLKSLLSVSTEKPLGGGAVTTSCVETGPAAAYTTSAEAARLTVIVVVPPLTSVTSHVDESMEANCVLLLS